MLTPYFYVVTQILHTSTQLHTLTHARARSHDEAQLFARDEGENLYMATGTFNASVRALNGWYDSEIVLYNFATPGYQSPAGHFTQVSRKIQYIFISNHND